MFLSKNCRTLFKHNKFNKRNYFPAWPNEDGEGILKDLGSFLLKFYGGLIVMNMSLRCVEHYYSNNDKQNDNKNNKG